MVIWKSQFALIVRLVIQGKATKREMLNVYWNWIGSKEYEESTAAESAHMQGYWCALMDVLDEKPWRVEAD